MTFDPTSQFFISDGLPMDHNSLNNAGPIRVLPQAADTSFYVCRDRKGKELPVIQIVDGRNKGMSAFWAYWCPYDQDRFGWVSLGTSADFMFTATMDGCSFGIGHAASDGSVLVGHTNSTRLQAPTGDTTLMEQDQKNTLKMMLGAGPGGAKKPKMFQPSDYIYRKKSREVSATTFAVRSNGKWRFYAHRWVKSYEGVKVAYEFLGTKRIH